MLLTGKFDDDPRLTSLPLEVYDTIVRSLHGNLRTLMAGNFATIVAGGLAWHKSNSPVLLAGLLILVLFSALRMWHIYSFNRRSHHGYSYKELINAEYRYKLYSGAYVGMIGVLCFLGFAVSQDGVVHLLLLSVCLANVAGISGRNFASPKVVNLQAIGATIPPTAGLVLFGSPYHIILACLLLPFLLAIQSISRHLRSTLLEATFQALDNKTIADRFEVALENASHGMAMVDSDGVFLVVNERFGVLFGLPEDFNLVGCSLTELTVFSLQQAPSITVNDDIISERVRNCLLGRKQTRFTHTRLDGATIEVSFNPMSEGAGVIVLEDVSDRVKSEQEIRQLANYDPLTHLPNRRHFTALAKNRIAKDGSRPVYSLFFADLDNFKTINDSLGHSIGDKLLCAVSLRMKSCLPEGGNICRFGGDEFVIMLPGVVMREDCERFARRLMAEVSKPVLIDGHLIIVGASVGVAISPDNGTEFEQLLKMADLSLYEAKANGRDEVFFYSQALGERIRKRQELEVDLRRAVQKGELSVHYQPLVDLTSYQVTACEALVRWNHPRLGFIPPSEFIPMAEEIGLISKIGRFVLETATTECARWPKNVRVAVNVSSLQFQQSDVCNIVDIALRKSGLPASRLEVEVTESAVLNDLQETSRILRTLAQGGVRISLDDFGTGFSSLSYLHQLPLDKVKIDRSFLESIRDDERSLVLLSGITRLAADLGLMVIVEGVEEEDQLAILRGRVHLDQAQGYLFGKAMPAEDIREVLAQNAPFEIHKASAVG